jgi:hypothetical protein
MSSHSSRTEPAVAATHVWLGLSTDQQQRAVRLLARLAYAQVRTNDQPPAQEDHHGDTPQFDQDSPRSS